jgi:hypothetical protein
MSETSEPHPAPRTEALDADVVVHPARLVEMTPVQHRETVRLLVALIDAALDRRRASRAATPSS